MSKLNWAKRACAIFLLWAATATALPAQTFTTIYNFCSKTNCADGQGPEGLVQASDGNFYGTTGGGGANGSLGGTVFRITPSGALTTLYSFCSQSNCADGDYPFAELVQGTDGNLYGTTVYGGASGEGTVFRITLGGTLTTLHSFDFTDGANPFGGLIQATDRKFYGTTQSGGTKSVGTVFKITPSGTLTTLYNFCSQTNCADGELPTDALAQGADGKFYGTTMNGGTDSSCMLNGFNGCGTVFKITRGGVLTTLHSFDYTGGGNPFAGLVQGANGKFYGTTEGGGANNTCISGCGTVFEITPSGTLTTLRSFDFTDGGNPYAGLIQGVNGKFYGTTNGGGAGNGGTVFSITANGILTTLHSFDYSDGAFPYSGLLQSTSGKFYGSSGVGGANGGGTIFALDLGLSPFVETNPTSGKIGALVKILGTNLAGATNVTFNGTPATFTVKSRTLIITTVPAGATSGTVQVVTPGSGTLSSNVVFRVRP